MRREQGFTLIETIIASSVIVLGIVGILSLNTSSLLVTQVTEAEFMASQLARQGIEVVRAIRDSNWLKYDTDSTTAWNANLSDSTDYTAILQDPLQETYLDFTTDTLTETCAGASASTYVCSTVWYDVSAQGYIQTDSSLFNPASVNYEDSSYKRLITLNPICRSNAAEETERIVTSGSACNGSETQVGIDVIVEVQYQSKGSTASYILEEHLYDWKF